jgi:hypothetical protein
MLLIVSAVIGRRSCCKRSWLDFINTLKNSWYLLANVFCFLVNQWDLYLCFFITLSKVSKFGIVHFKLIWHLSMFFELLFHLTFYILILFFHLFLDHFNLQAKFLFHFTHCQIYLIKIALVIYMRQWLYAKLPLLHLAIIKYFKELLLVFSVV